jgi:hypothetical protein
VKTAKEPFQFVTAAYLTRICNQVAGSLGDLVSGLENCSDASIFYHTFQTLGSHHFLTEGFSNDFAQWVQAATNRDSLAEQLAALDIRDYVSLAKLRRDLQRLVEEYCRAFPGVSAQAALEPFYFCESVETTVPLDFQANTLDEFRNGVAKLSHSSFHFHFISSRLRLHLQTNDFSRWLAVALELEKLASLINRIDIYTNTLDSVRAKVLRLIDAQRSMDAQRNVA